MTLQTLLREQAIFREEVRRDIANLGKKMDLMLGAYEKYPVAKRTKRIVSEIVQNAELKHQQANKLIVNN